MQLPPSLQVEAPGALQTHPSHREVCDCQTWHPWWDTDAGSHPASDSAPSGPLFGLPQSVGHNEREELCAGLVFVSSLTMTHLCFLSVWICDSLSPTHWEFGHSIVSVAFLSFHSGFSPAGSLAAALRRYGVLAWAVSNTSDSCTRSPSSSVRARGHLALRAQRGGGPGATVCAQRRGCTL